MSEIFADQVAILSFYSFTTIESPAALLPKILLIAKKKYLKGTILLAKEGFNGTISGQRENVELLASTLIKITAAQNVNVKINYAAAHPFPKLKVKLKAQIIAINKGESLLINGEAGEYIAAEDWDHFISEPDVLVIDTRNDYEINHGAFKNAVNPHTQNFKQFPLWAEQNTEMFKDKKIAMYCTGGIRCEKSTAYLRMLGYNKVYHLQGGILQYLENTKNVNKLWQGKCFVFDERIAVDDNLTPSK